MRAYRFTPRQNRIGLFVLLSFIVLGHIALWASDGMPRDAKIRLTLINAIGWSVVLLPAWAVGKWLETHKALNARERQRQNTSK